MSRTKGARGCDVELRYVKTEGMWKATYLHTDPPISVMGPGPHEALDVLIGRLKRAKISLEGDELRYVSRR